MLFCIIRNKSILFCIIRGKRNVGFGSHPTGPLSRPTGGEIPVPLLRFLRSILVISNHRRASCIIGRYIYQLRR